jgi:TatD DNase family protein
MRQPQFVDTHCHLDFKDYEGNIAPVIEAAQAFGIRTLVNICTTYEEADQVIHTAHQFAHVYASVGIHPHDAGPTLEKFTTDELYSWLLTKAADPRVIALGETGLDYYYDNSPREAQRESFAHHIKAAEETGLPLSVHTRSAQEDTIQLLQERKGQISGVIHCFSETQWLADAALKLGFYISVAGIITFKNADALREVVRTVPLDRLLLETDAPFLAPVPYRGKRNEPAFMIETAKVVAGLKGVTLDKLAQQTTENFHTLFKKARK